MAADIRHRLDLLVSPDDHTALTITSTGLQSSATPPVEYRIQQGVPVLLPRALPPKEAPLPGQAGAAFAYAEHYQRDAQAFDYFETIADPAGRHENHRLHQTILRQIPSGKGRVLDMGCGNAWLAAALCPRGMEVWSADISTDNPTKALHRYPFDNHFAVVADAFHLPFREYTFDVVLAVEIIEHVPDPAAFVAALLRVLRPGGQLIITTPYREQIQYSLCVHCNHPTPHNAHLHSFDEQALRRLLPAGKVEKVRIFSFSNKALQKLQTHILLQFLPYALWRLVDAFANWIIRKPSRLLMRVGLPGEVSEDTGGS
jgi:SAM-dependent methyltransferase/uncharacterized protein YbaR (Trm112 family)